MDSVHFTVWYNLCCYLSLLVESEQPAVLVRDMHIETQYYGW
jgi:hypothetical protein